MTKLSFDFTNDSNFHNFIIFDDTWLRIGEHEIIMRGQEIYDTFFEAYEQIQNCDDIKAQIICHRLDKVANMLEMVKNYDTMILTKFFNKVWKRYYTMSENGEQFLDLSLFKQTLPDLSKINPIFADRIVPRGGGNGDDDDDNENTTNTDKNSSDLNTQLNETLEEISV